MVEELISYTLQDLAELNLLMQELSAYIFRSIPTQSEAA